MTVGEHQGLGLVPKGLGSGAEEFPKAGRAGPSPDGASPTTGSEEAGQGRGAAPNPGHHAPPLGMTSAEVML